MPEKKLNDHYLFEEYKNKVYRPSKKEINNNIRSRSAKLRFAIRSKHKFEHPRDLTKNSKIFRPGGNQCLKQNY